MWFWLNDNDKNRFWMIKEPCWWLYGKFKYFHLIQVWFGNLKVKRCYFIKICSFSMNLDVYNKWRRTFMVETKRNQIKIILTSFNYQWIHNSVVYIVNLFKNEAKDERIVLYNFANMIYDDYIKDYLKITTSHQMTMIR